MVNMSSPIDQLDARLIALLRDEPRIGLMEVAAGSASRAARCRPGWPSSRSAAWCAASAPRSTRAGMGYPVLAFVFLQIAQGRLKEAVARARGGARGPRGRRRRAARATCSAAIVARDTEHLQEIVNRAARPPAIRRSTSYIALCQQIPYRTEPLVAAAGAEPA